MGLEVDPSTSISGENPFSVIGRVGRRPAAAVLYLDQGGVRVRVDRSSFVSTIYTILSGRRPGAQQVRWPARVKICKSLETFFALQ